VDYALACVIISVKTCASMQLSDSLVTFHRVPLHCPHPILQFPTNATNDPFSNFIACRDIPEGVREFKYFNENRVHCLGCLDQFCGLVF
jgi:hypothetical protein